MLTLVDIQLTAQRDKLSVFHGLSQMTLLTQAPDDAKPGAEGRAL